MRVAIVSLSMAACAACAASVEPVAGPGADAGSPQTDDSPVDAASAWRSLSTQLPGHWRAQIGEYTVDVFYRMTAQNSVIVETWMPGTAAETLTAYHLDGPDLMLTHYCGQGNQPRLRLTRDDAGQLHFARFDATDLAADEAALSRLSLALDGPRLTRTESYVQGQDREDSMFEFTRATEAR